MNNLYGRNPICEALKAFREIKKIIISETSHGPVITEIISLAQKQNVEVVRLQQIKFDKLQNSEKSQGVMAEAAEHIFVTIETLFAIAKSKNENPFFVIFDEIEDPHNLGALIRTALCCGAHGGIIPKHHTAPINQTVAKTSSGAIEHFPLARVSNIVSTIDSLKEENITVIGTEMNAKTSFTNFDLNIPIAIIIGNEGRGMRKMVLEHCSDVVKIPMSPLFDSLNASVAGGIVMYETFRQRTNSTK
ncbi:MAG: 23S rRNA (guanosine(2251)-2'-O)-methyltransferase RlmB [Ignavibacteria bacterium]|nr:23S rRNA (guanosine(2251)-2'-O)-methyltransferase RlmB [Bacteroidota bacterium]MSQ46021.1 23S rRNA (guanosine(2251)-2'-O)-methyltransferase RlmB [Ignavibacteria bacterium]